MMQNFIYIVLRCKFFTYKFDLLEEIKCFCLLTKCKLAFWFHTSIKHLERTIYIYIYIFLVLPNLRQEFNKVFIFTFLIYYLLAFFFDEIVVHADLISPFMQLCTFIFPSSSNRGNLAHFLLCKDSYYYLSS
jgi:hypothetical protein